MDTIQSQIPIEILIRDAQDQIRKNHPGVSGFKCAIVLGRIPIAYDVLERGTILKMDYDRNYYYEHPYIPGRKGGHFAESVIDNCPGIFKKFEV